jgi:acyl carrier protein
MNLKPHGPHTYDPSKEVDISLQDEIIDIIVTLYDISIDEISMESHLKNDLGLDSLDSVEIAIECEERFKISLTDSDIHKIHYMRDLYKMISKRKAKIEAK